MIRRAFDSTAAAIGALCLVLSTFLLAQYKNTGYAIDLYNQVPAAYWAGLIMAFASGAALVTSPRAASRATSLVLMAGAYVHVIWLPQSLGFFTYGRGDQLTHIGTVRAVIRDSHTAPDLIYPAGHLEAAAISLMADIGANEAAAALGLLASFCLILGLAALARAFTDTTSGPATGLAILVSTPLFAGWLHFTMLPNFVFFSLTPLIVLTLVRVGSAAATPWRVVLVILVLTVPFGHPVIFVFTLVCILLAAAMLSFGAAGERVRGEGVLGYAGIMLVTFLLWFLHSVGFQRRLATTVRAFQQGSTEAVIVEGIEKGATISPTLVEWLRLAIFYGGRYIVPLAIIGFWFLGRLRNPGLLRLAWRDRLLIGWFVALLVIQVLLVGNRFFSQSPNRALNLNFVLLAMVPLVLLALREVLERRPTIPRGLAIGATFTLLFGVTAFGALDSPLILKPSQAVANNEVASAEWIFGNRGTDLIYDNLGGYGIRFGDLIVGPDERKTSLAVPSKPKAPDHFGYDEDWIGETGSMYLVVTSLGETLYQTLYDRLARYTAEDFERVDNDVRLSRIYSTTDIRAYYQAPPQVIEF